MKVTRDRPGRRGVWIALWRMFGVLALLTSAVWIAGNVSTPSVGARGVCARVSPSQLQVAIANQPVRWSGNRWFFPESSAAVIMPGSIIRPTMTEASMTVGTQAGATKTISLRVVNVPLWQMLLAFLIAGGASWRFAARSFPVGHCHACGYDLRGLGSGRCPECGEGFLARLAGMASRAFARRRGMCPGRGTSLSGA